MKTSDSSRESILKRIKTARNGRSYFHSIKSESKNNIYKPILSDRLTCFKNELEAISGKCVICENDEDLFIKLKDFLSRYSFPYLFCRDEELRKLLANNGIDSSNNDKDFEDMHVGITNCEFLIARTGTVVVSSASLSGRQMHIFPPTHIVIAQASQLVDYVEDGLNSIQKKYGNMLPSAITSITGPSRTADIEKTLVLGAHGPKEIIVFVSKE